MDWDKWAKDGAKFSDLPDEVKSRAKDELVSASNSVVVNSREHMNLDSGFVDSLFKSDDSSEEISSQVKKEFERLSKQSRYTEQLSSLRKELGDDFQRYSSAARQLIEQKGYDPKDAFLLVSHDDRVKAAVQSAQSVGGKEDAIRQRNSEVAHRGSGGEAPKVETGPWSEENYNGQLTKLRRMDFKDSVKWMKENPEFIGELKTRGELKEITR
tara:strand:- start:110 stop:748 length:639 start_codon:yes stop_codon:yes gene_type:complete